MKHKIVIVGTGFGGIASAIQLQKKGYTDFVLLERAGDVGGVWRDNIYPGAACDVQSHLYSLSYAPNANWTRAFSPQPEIFEYLKRCADDFKLNDKIRFNCEVQRMQWSEATGEWSIDTNQGQFQAQYVVGAFGALSDPAYPNIEGLDTFKGSMLHTARWDKSVDLKGKRVAVIGTGASAIQLVPAIADEVAALKLFQRSAAWVMPRHDGPIGEAKQQRFEKFKLTRLIKRLYLYLTHEFNVLGFMAPSLLRLASKKAVKHIHSAISDPVLREKVTPDYVMGCKRILLSDDYYPALAKEHVDVVTNGIERIAENGIIDGDGQQHEVDVIALGTGFKVKDLPWAHQIFDETGESLAEVWQQSPKSYMGTAVHGFPNLFLIHGPNIGLGHNSVIFMFEAQADHLCKVIDRAEKQGKQVVEATARAQQDFTRWVDKAMSKTVWTTGGCDSWYLDDTGRNSALWPGSTIRYNYIARRLKGGNYDWREPASATSRTSEA